MGSVITNPGGSGRPCSSNVPRNVCRVLIARRLVSRSRLLHRRPLNGGADSSPIAVARARAAARACASSVSSPRSAVAVFEVDPQVLDRLGGQLGQDQRVHLGGYPWRESGRGGEFGRPWRELLERGQGLCAPLADRLRSERVRGHVGRVDGLPAENPAGVAGLEFRIGDGEQAVEVLGQVVEGPRLRRASHG